MKGVTKKPVSPSSFGYAQKFAVANGDLQSPPFSFGFVIQRYKVEY